MLASILPVPFADAARQQQYDAVLAALRAETIAPATVLLGNLAAFTPLAVDALLVQPNALALLVLTPRAGQLTMATLAYGNWQLGGQALPGRAETDNPFAQYQQQLPAALTWLSEQLAVAELPPCVGMALFEAPLTFGPEVEAQLHQHAAAHDFQLVGGAAQVPRRLPRLPLAPAALAAPALQAWADQLLLLTNETFELADDISPNYLTQKLQQLWRWLGAEDIPADPPYGSAPPDAGLRDQQEQVRLQQLRQELQAELHQQRQEATAREAARAQELALLRQQLAQAGPSATERQAEQRAKADLEESLRTARTELTTRSHELDARIKQLGQLIERLQTTPPAQPAQPGGALASSRRTQPVAASAWSFRRLRQAERWGLLALALASVGAGTWGFVRWAQHPVPSRAATVVRHSMPENDPAESQLPDLENQTDSIATAQATAADSTNLPLPESTLASPAESTTPELITPTAPLVIDSTNVASKPTPLLTGPDSTTRKDSPTP